MLVSILSIVYMSHYFWRTVLILLSCLLQGIDSSNLFETKVVTDIDDTVVSSGGLNIFGITLGGIDR